VSATQESALVAWTVKKALKLPHLELTADALLSKWNGRKWKDVLATFRVWVMRPAPGGGDAIAEPASGYRTPPWLAKYLTEEQIAKRKELRQKVEELGDA